MHNAGNTLHNPVTLTFDLGTAGSVHAKDLPYSMRVPSIVLIAQVVFCSIVDKQTHICH